MAVKKSPKRATMRAAKPAAKRAAAKAPVTKSPASGTFARKPGGGRPRPVRKADLVATVRHINKWLVMLEALLVKLPATVQITPDSEDYEKIEDAVGDVPPVDGPPCC